MGRYTRTAGWGLFKLPHVRRLDNEIEQALQELPQPTKETRPDPGRLDSSGGLRKILDAVSRITGTIDHRADVERRIEEAFDNESGYEAISLPVQGNSSSYFLIYEAGSDKPPLLTIRTIPDPDVIGASIRDAPPQGSEDAGNVELPPRQRRLSEALAKLKADVSALERSELSNTPPPKT
jgi:hypothetical protein